jgi:two-component system heavy metal sensor histidine kinase CusS
MSEDRAAGSELSPTAGDLSRSSALSLSAALGELRARSAVVIGGVRLGGWTAFLALAAFLGLARGLQDWRASLPLHALYVGVAALLLWALRNPKLRERVGAAVPILDVASVYWLQHDSLPRSPFPAGVAGWSLGPFVLLVLLASLTLRPRLIYATALAASLCEGLLQAQAGVGAGAIISSAIILLLAASATHWATGRIEALLGNLVREQVQARLQAERSEELARAHAALGEAKAELEQQHRQLLSAQREAEVLSSLLVHDMKSPLSTLMMRLELAQRHTEGQPGLVSLAKDLRISRLQGQRLLGMIEDLLAIARLERGALEPHTALVDVTALLQSVASSYEGVAQTLQARVSVAGDPGTTAVLDRELIERVLENLTSNALRYVRAGDRVELSCVRRGPEVVLAVKNSGPLALADSPDFAVCFVLRLPVEGPQQQS